MLKHIHILNYVSNGFSQIYSINLAIYLVYNEFNSMGVLAVVQHRRKNVSTKLKAVILRMSYLKIMFRLGNLINSVSHYVKERFLLCILFLPNAHVCKICTPN